MTRSVQHIVAQGETLRSIAAAYGVSTIDIWDHPNNAQLRRDREPNVLASGDRIWIPSSEEPWIEYGGAPVPCRTGRRHTFCHALLVAGALEAG